MTIDNELKWIWKKSVDTYKIMDKTPKYSRVQKAPIKKIMSKWNKSKGKTIPNTMKQNSTIIQLTLNPISII